MTLADTRTDGYRAMTEGAALVDRSERGKLALTGADAKDFLQGQVTNDVVALRPGEGCYAAFLTHKGKMLGDLRVLDAGEELLLDCERVALQELFTLIRRFKLGRDVELHKRTLERGLQSLVGPAARAVAGAPVRLIVTDVGVDVLCDVADTERIAAALAAAGAVPASEDAAEDRERRWG